MLFCEPRLLSYLTYRKWGEEKEKRKKEEEEEGEEDTAAVSNWNSVNFICPLFSPLSALCGNCTGGVGAEIRNKELFELSDLQ